ncbi:MAG: PAS domain-containing sensor histidine kinase [Deltaproteobacteria bacterium]|nr:PAS domain-containing sensor histidine kinase [Deltaproteobacteria bacterium]
MFESPLDFDLTQFRRPSEAVASEEAVDAEITTPHLSLDAQLSLAQYFALCKAHAQNLEVEFLAVARQSPALRQALDALTPEELRARSAAFWASKERAVVLDDWQPCLGALHTLGRAAVGLGIPFGDWCHIANVLRARLVRFAAAEVEPSNLLPILDGAHNFISIATACLGAAYLAANEARIRSERRHREMIFEGAIDAILSLDSEHRILSLNPQASRIFGWPLHQLKGRVWTEVLLADGTGQRLQEAISRDVREGTRDTLGHRLESMGRRRSGEAFPIEVAVVRLEGAQSAYAAFVKDISRERELEKSTRFLAVIVQSSADAIIGMDPAGNVLSWNPGATALYGFEASEAVGRNLGQLIGAQPDGPLMSSLGSLARGEPLPTNAEGTHRHKSGHRVHVSIGLSPLRADDGSVAAIAAIARDIGPRKRAEAKLAEKARELARSNEELTQFASVASHDLRAPLRAVESLSRLLEAELGANLGERCAEHLKHLRSRVTRMDRMVEDLLAYACVGHHEERTDEVDLSAVAREVIAAIPLRGAFKINVPDPLPVVRAHGPSLERVLFNLIGNAVKHHHRDDGTVTIRATVAPARAAHRSRRDSSASGREASDLVLAVDDDGPGISSELRERAFGMFFTSKPESTGSGMGLAIVRKLVETRGGTVELLDGPMGGLLVRVRWPLEPRSPA